MRYMLRVVIYEDLWERQMADIINLCRKAGIEEVLLMEQSHQMVMVPYSLDKHKRMADIYCIMEKEFRREGIIFSINLATLVGHEDADIKDELVLPYQKFTGERLEEARANYCILDEGWQDYAAEVCSLYASSKPDKIFIDDDFRSLNHSAMVGCFCPIHAKRTSEECEMELTPQMLFKNVCGNSILDLKVKTAWMKVNFEGQVQAAVKMRNAVEKISPGTRLGLMNSGEETHSLQGRDMDKLVRTFSGDVRRPVSRPAGGGYSDVIHGGIFGMHQQMALSMNVLGRDIQIVSEVENWPHTRFTKSILVTKTQMELHMLAGADDITLNLYDYMATPYDQEPDFCKLLISEKERLNLIQKARRGKKLKGIGLPWKIDTAAKLVNRAGNLSGLFPDRRIDCLLAQFGIPTQFEVSKGNVIFGDMVNCYNDAEINSLLKGGLMLDTIAFENLYKRGFGKLLGCEPDGVIKGIPAIERLEENEFSGKFAGNLMTTNWFRLGNDGRYINNLKPAKDAKIISSIVDDRFNEISPGVVLYENEMGGRTAVFAVPVGSWEWLYRNRAYQVARIADWLMYGEMQVWIEDCPNVGPFYYEDGDTGEGLLGIASGNIDVTDVKVHAKFDMFDLFNGGRVKSFTIEPLTVRFFRTARKENLSVYTATSE